MTSRPAEPLASPEEAQLGPTWLLADLQTGQVLRVSHCHLSTELRFAEIQFLGHYGKAVNPAFEHCQWPGIDPVESEPAQAA